MAKTNTDIIVVDDDEGVKQAIERLLNASGFRAVTFPSAEALLETGGTGNAACLVLDIHLPGLSGFELRHRLAQNGARLPVVFITAFDDSDSQASAKRAGAVACLTKPFEAQQLLGAIAEALTSNRR